jgi:hypothetical protein
VPVARDALVEGLGTWLPDEAEDAFRAFWVFYRSVVRVHDTSIDTPEMVNLLITLCEARECGYYLLRSLESSKDAAVSAGLNENRKMLEPAREVQRNGVEIIYGEGNLYRAQDPAYLKALAASLPARPFREFVEFYAREDEVFVYDASIVISWQRLGERLARWEAFRVGHPELPETKGVVEPEIERLREFYLCGVGGTTVYNPGYGPGPRSIDPQVLASYKRFVFQNPRSDTTPIVRGVLERLGRTKGVMEDELRTYIRQVLKNARTACER